jgi:thioredoxin reductase (NADPH)
MSRVLTTDTLRTAAQAERLGETYLVVGLCAAWCGTCREFRVVFERLAELWPDVAFVWLDIEDDSAIAGDIDVENFPTLAVFHHGLPVHFGVSEPSEGVVTRLVNALLTGPSRPASVPREVALLPALLSGHARSS